MKPTSILLAALAMVAMTLSRTSARTMSKPQRIPMVRALVAASTLALAALLAGSVPAVAGSGSTVETFPVSFVLSSDVCPHLPAGTTITGSGTERSITSMPSRGGVLTVVNSSHARGTAVDQDGNTYIFNYSNEFRVSQTADGLFTGRMTDSFSLTGQGPAKLNNGFVAVITTDLQTFFLFDPIHSHSDPINFADGSAICDPL